MANGDEVQLGRTFTGEQIKQLRKDKGLDLKDVQAQLKEHGHDLGLSTLSRMETGKGRGPTIEELLALAIILDATPNRLLFGGSDLTAPGRSVDMRLSRLIAAASSEVWGWADGHFYLGFRERLSTVIQESQEDLDAYESGLPSAGRTEAMRDRRRRHIQILDEAQKFREKNRIAEPPSDTPAELIERIRESGDTLPNFLRRAHELVTAGLTWQDLQDELVIEKARHEYQAEDQEDRPGGSHAET